MVLVFTFALGKNVKEYLQVKDSWLVYKGWPIMALEKTHFFSVMF